MPTCVRRGSPEDDSIAPVRVGNVQDHLSIVNAGAGNRDRDTGPPMNHTRGRGTSASTSKNASAPSTTRPSETFQSLLHHHKKLSHILTVRFLFGRRNDDSGELARARLSRATRHTSDISASPQPHNPIIHPHALVTIPQSCETLPRQTPLFAYRLSSISPPL